MSDDVKIYIGKTELNKTSGEISSAFDTVILNRNNGNLDKARQLGALLATIDPTADTPMSLKLKDTLPQKLLVQDILYQIKVLLIFACEAVLQISVPVELISNTAIASMYSEIEKQSPTLYENIANGAAFTFYYLALQKGSSDASQSIADAFAMLCGVKNKADFIDAGKAVWTKAVEMIEDEIEKAGFKEI